MPRPPSTRNPVLTIRNVSVQRGHSRILRNISWSVEQDQHWVMLGANGSGKTSLLKVLTGYLMPSAGSIELLLNTYGESDWREIRKRIGIVSSAVSQMMPDDEPALETVVSGLTAMIGLWRRVATSDHSAARRLLRQLGCARLADRPWGVLSQGERQRVLIARALMPKPALLVLDEPCAGLDPVGREHFLQFINKLGRQPSSPTLVLVTHHVEEIMPVFSRVLVMKGGRTLFSGLKKEALTSKVMSKAFGGGVGVHSPLPGRYALRVSVTRGRRV